MNDPNPPTSPLEPINSPDREAIEIAEEAYIYGYPLITMEITRRVMTNTVTPENNHAPMGQFYNAKTYPSASFRDVTAPNADTLYSTAWLDVSREPYIFSLPDMNGRYFLMPMLSAWTDVIAVPGARTTGEKAQKYAITGPGWRGTLPSGVTEIKFPTALVWILGRTYSSGTPEDYRAVHDLQAQYQLVPLSAHGKPYTPPNGTIDPAIDGKTPVREQVHALSPSAYFSLLADLLAENPPSAADAPIVQRMAKIGIVPGQKFNASGLSPTVVQALPNVPKTAIGKIMAHQKEGGMKVVNGWIVSLDMGEYGTDYLQRAFITAIGLGANKPQDAVYPLTTTDNAGQKLNGSNRYVLRFPEGQTPPVCGFWSLTMYDADFFFVNNPLNKYTVSPRNNLKYNPDGSLDIYVQNESPGKDREANWLPAPAGDFKLMLRMYWPDEKDPSILDGTWQPPAVERVN
ncbi:DUF1254 domain-containing protein [Pannus brasiliensis CCIBt3594]|uniref:DUF1254 domain-containing protein n=1 Tax=Pannus brasiliensis CCIBt3594 TaxID=1427578 RepID=A0AAW9QYS7_9CHRO